MENEESQREVEQPPARQHRSVTKEGAFGKELTVDEYPSGHLRICVPDDNENIYLESDMASVLRVALDTIDAQKRGEGVSEESESAIERALDELKIETPHPKLTFDRVGHTLPEDSKWLRCPECGSQYVETFLAQVDGEETAWFRSNTVIWLECMSCENKSGPTVGDYVAQSDNGDTLKQHWLIEAVKALVK